jgi:hypothetical protein
MAARAESKANDKAARAETRASEKKAGGEVARKTRVDAKASKSDGKRADIKVSTIIGDTCLQTLNCQIREPFKPRARKDWWSLLEPNFA